MPYFISPSRRQFLESCLGGVALLRIATAQSKPAATRWAFLSDTHIPADPAAEFRGFRPYDNLNAAVPKVLQAAPEGVVIDGDLARLQGLPGDYENFKMLLQPLAEAAPICMSLGNHDHRRNFLKAFSETPGRRQPVKGKCVVVLEHRPVRFLVLDSLLQANVTPGLLGKAQRQWLAQYLASADDTPTLVFVHHTLDDSDNSLLDVEQMFQILTPCKQVKAVIYGHSHRYHFDTQDGLHLVNIPAVGYNFNDSEPVGWTEATLSAEGADFKLHAFGGNMESNGKIKSIDWRG
jgi:Icc protein